MRITAERRAHNHDSLIRAGLMLFGRQGFVATTVDQVAMAAGVAKGTFYNYFQTKEDLALAAFVAALEEIQGRLDDLLAHGSLQERLGALFVHFDQWAVHPELIWVWCLENLRRGRAEPASALLRHILTAVFADAQDRGEVRRDRDADLLALDLEGIILSHIAAWYHEGAEGDLMADLRGATDAYIQGAREMEAPDVGHA